MLIKQLCCKEPPSRKVLTRRCLPNTFKVFGDHIKDVISKQVQQFTITSDIWTDSVRRLPYACFTLHYSSDFESKEILLDIRPFQGSHTGEAIGKLCKEILDQYDLDIKKMRIVTDCGSNMISAANIIGVKWRPCLAHRINTLVMKALSKHSSAIEVVAKCRDIYKALLFKKELLRDGAKLESLEEIERVGPHVFLNEDEPIEKSQTPRHATSRTVTLKTDVKSRWNSTYLMIQTIRNIESQVQSALFRIKKPDLLLTGDDIDEIDVLIEILKPFYDITMILSKNQSVPPVCAFFELTSLKDQLDALKISLMNPTGLSLVCDLLSDFPTKIQITKEMMAASLLDPILKDSQALKDAIELEFLTSAQLLIEYLAKYKISASSTGESQSTSAQVNPDDQWRQKYIVQRCDSDCLSDMVSKYLNSTFSVNVRMKEHWRANPGPLAELANVFCSMQMTSVASERTFSVSGSLVTTKRGSIDPLNVKMLMFINRNFDFCSSTLSQLKSCSDEDALFLFNDLIRFNFLCQINTA